MAIELATIGQPIILLNALTTGTSPTIAIPSTIRKHKFIIKGAAALTVGKIQPETADDAAYAGTWAPVGGGPIDCIASAEVEYSFEGFYPFLRARFSTPSDQAVTVTYYGA